MRYLKSLVSLETSVGKLRIDMTVGREVMHKRHGIEIKFTPGDNSIKEIIGQMEIYRKEFENLYLLVYKPQYSLEKKMQLKEFLNNNDITLIETIIEQ